MSGSKKDKRPRKPARAVEVVQRPELYSFDIDHVREFLQAERVFQMGLAAAGAAEVPLSELIDPVFVLGIPDWISTRPRYHPGKSADELTDEDKAPYGALPQLFELTKKSEVAEWCKCVLEALKGYVADASVPKGWSVTTIEKKIKQRVSWDTDAASYLEALSNFRSQYVIACIQLQLPSVYNGHEKGQKDTVKLLVKQLRPAAWSLDVSARVSRGDIKNVADLWTFLATEERAYVGYCGGLPHHDDADDSSVDSSRGLVHRFRARIAGSRAAGHDTQHRRGRASADSTRGSSSQTRACWSCGSPDHLQRDCPGSSTSPRVTFATPVASAMTKDDRRGASVPPTTGWRGRHGRRTGANSTRGGNRGTSTSRGAGGSRSRGFARAATRARPGADSPQDGVILPKSINLPVCLDSGCTDNFASPANAALLLRQVPGAVSVTLPQPVDVFTASADTPLVAESKIVCTLQVLWSDGTAWPVHNAEVLVVNGLSDSEVLIGRSVIVGMPPGLPQRVWQQCGLVPPTAPPLPDLVRRVDASLHDAALDNDGTEFDPGQPLEPADTNDVDAVHAALDAAISAARPTLGDAATAVLADAVHGELFDMFRVSMIGDPAARVPPVVINFVPGASAPRLPPRRSSPQAAQFLRDTMSKLERHGMVRKVLNAVHGSPAYAVRKPHADPTAPLDRQLRLVCDLRAVNAVSVPCVQPLPRPEAIVDFLSSKAYHGCCDLLDGYWQIPLAEQCQPWFTFVTPDGCFQPTRLPQGTVNGTGPFQATIVSVLGALVWSACVVYVDDIAVTGDDSSGLVANWLSVLRSLHGVGFKLRATKIQFAEVRLRFCGRVFGPRGVEYDPEYLSSIVALPRPGTAAELATLLAMAGWVRDSLPRFAEVVAPLQALLLHATRSAGAASKAARARVQLADFGWDAVHDQALANLKSLVAAATALAYPDPAAAVCVWTDASDGFFSAVVTTCAHDELQRPVPDQRHSPVLFLSGAFKGAQLRYSVLEKECFALVWVFHRAQHILRRPAGVHVFLDHRNAVFLLSPDANVPAGRRPAQDRIERWRAFLGGFRFSLQHVSTEDNFFSDALSRWAALPDAAAVDLPRNTPIVVPTSVNARAASTRRSPPPAPASTSECAPGGACGCGAVCWGVPATSYCTGAGPP